MRCIALNGRMVADCAALFPAEIFFRIINEPKQIRALGVEFCGEIKGAVAWEIKDGKGVLLSIYVRPSARRLGLGSVMIAELSRKLLFEKCNGFTVAYRKDERFKTLTPFFSACGIMLDETEMPFGRTTLGKAKKALSNMRILKRTNNCRAIHTLTPSELVMTAQLIYETTGESISGYMESKPESFVFVEKNQVKGLLLMDEDDGVLWLDYLWVPKDSHVALARLFDSAIESLESKYPSENKINIMLSTEHAKRLYSKLIGGEIGETIIYRGTYDIPSGLIATAFR